MTNNQKNNSGNIDEIPKNDYNFDETKEIGENLPTVSVDEIKENRGGTSFEVKIVNNDLFKGVLLRQFPGEGNELHYHDNSDECWVIIEGEWEWYIEGEGTKRVKKGDIVTIKKDTKHKIKCVGDKPAVRFAIIKSNASHIHAEKK